MRQNAPSPGRATGCLLRGTAPAVHWERDKPIYPTGLVELQNHGNTLWFKNIYVKELPRE